MDILLDTVTFLMIIAAPEKLSSKAKRLFTDPDNSIYVSVISGWEILVKHTLGKLPLTVKPEALLTEEVKKHDIQVISLEMNDVLRLTTLSGRKDHKDPFDRMLVCQAMARKIPILTPDPLIKRYNVSVVW